MKIKIALFVILSVFTNELLANAKVIGNGGDAVVCRNSKNHILSAQLLDHYEFEVMDGGKIDLGSNDLNEIQKVEQLIERMRIHNPSRAHLYLQGLKNFYLETTFVDQKLEDIDDSGDVIMPRGCAIEQLAIQLTCRPGTLNRPYECESRVEENYHNWDIVYDRYRINKGIWEKLDKNSKAGLILHELIYREASNLLHQENSISVRKINTNLSSIDITRLNQSEYNEIFLKNHFGTVDIDVLDGQQKSTYFVTYFWPWGVLHENRVQFHGNGVLKHASPRYQHKDSNQIVPLWINGKMYKVSQSVTALDNRGYEFNNEGQLQGLKVAADSNLYPLNVAGRTYEVEAFQISNHPSEFGMVYFQKKGVFNVPFFNKEVRVGQEPEKYAVITSINNRGKLVSGKLVDSFIFESVNHNLMSLPGSFIRTDADSVLIKAIQRATGWAKGATDSTEVKIENSAISFNDDQNIQLVKKTDEDPTSSVSGSTALPNGKVLRFRDFYSFDYSAAPSFIIKLKFGLLEQPLVCIHKGLKYSIQKQVTLNIGRIVDEPIRIVYSEELKNILKRNETCDVERN